MPANQSIGIDPNTFPTATVPVPRARATIPVSTLGSANSPEDIVAGPYEVVPPGQNSTGLDRRLHRHAGGPPMELTGCTSSSSVTVAAGDDLVQVFATAAASTNRASPRSTGTRTPYPTGRTTQPARPAALHRLHQHDGGVAADDLHLQRQRPQPALPRREHRLLRAVQREPDDQGRELHDDNERRVHVRERRRTHDRSDHPAGNGADDDGLVAPDGIVGTIPSYPGAPSGSTVILYTEKILSYYIEGTTNASISLPSSTIAYTPSVTGSEEPLPPTGTTFTVYLGTTTSAPIQAVTCTGNSLSGGIETLSGCSGGTGTVASGNWVGGPGAAIEPYSVLEQTGEGNNGSSKGPEKLFGNNEDYTVLRAAYTTNGVNFTDLGPISGTDPNTGSTGGSYEDINDPSQQCSPGNTTSCSTPSTTGSPQNLAAGSPDSVEMRWVGSRGTIIVNPDGSYGMFLSGAWASDGDSDAFNQIFYSSSTDGEHWTVPQVVLSTDYTFAASIAQQGTTNPLGISAYYSGRAYGPSVVQNPDGTLTMVFSGYRLPKPITSDGTVLGTNTSSQYTISPNDPALYRNILTMTLDSATSPGVATTTSVTSSTGGNAASNGQSITYTATVTVNAPGTGTPTGTVTFTDNGDAMSGCSNIKLADSAPDTATCTATSPCGKQRRQGGLLG